MSQSDSYYDAVARQQDFNDSVILKPISLKPTVVPSILGRSNPQNTILAAYDKIKITEYIESSEDGRVIQLISLDEKSHFTVLNPEGIEFLQRFSGTDITFVMVTGQKGSGKSFFIDKLLNLSNIQGNNFSMNFNKPAINIWSTPFFKEQLRFFIAEVSGCAPGSKQFDILLPYVTVLSSVVLNIENFKQKSTSRSYEKLDEKLNNFLDQFTSQKLDKQQNRTQVLNNIFPKIVYKLTRSVKDGAYFSPRSQIRAEQLLLPNAKNPQYRGIDDDLRIHSFLNKKCVSEHYINQISGIFTKILTEVSEKKHRELVFNGGIILKYLGQLSLLFRKGKNIDIGKVYYDIVKDLYISAYNYCVICYHESLQGALADQKPRSLQELIEIFEASSSQIFEKYNEFSLEKSIHEEYEEKLEKHIESKQRLILEINRKKTEMDLKKIYDESINLNDLNKIWGQMNAVNKQYPTYSHGRDIVMGRKLSEVISKLNTGNNVDYILKKNIQKLAQQIKSKNQELASIKEFNSKAKNESDEKRKVGEQQRAELMSMFNEKDKRIEELKKQIRIYQNVELNDPTKSKLEEKALVQRVQKNDQILEQLRAQSSEPIENTKEIKMLQNRIEQVQSKYKIQDLTLQEIQSSLQTGENPQGQQTQMKLKKEASNVPQKKEEPKKKQVSSNIGNSKKNSK